MNVNSTKDVKIAQQGKNTCLYFIPTLYGPTPCFTHIDELDVLG